MDCPCGNSGASGEICERCGAEFALVTPRSTIGPLLFAVGGGVVGLFVGVLLRVMLPRETEMQTVLGFLLFLACVVGGAIVGGRLWSSGPGSHEGAEDDFWNKG